MIYAKHGPEAIVFFTKPLAFVARLLQAQLSVVLIGRAVTG